MKRVGFIDLGTRGLNRLLETTSPDRGKKGIEALTIYIFKKIPRGYEFERMIRSPDEGLSPVSTSSLNGVKDFYLCLPLEALNFRILKLPFSEPDKLREIIPFELDGLIMDGLDSVVFDAVLLGGSDSNFDVLVAYMKKETLRGILGRLNSLGIDPRIITSIDLQAIIKGGTEDVASRLLNPVETELNSDDRINAAAEELMVPTLNLRTGSFAYTKETEKINRALKLTAALSISLALVINSDLLTKSIGARRQTSLIRSEIRNQYVALFPGEKRITDEVYLMKSHLREIQGEGDAIMDVNPLQFLLDLSLKTPPGLAFYEISLANDLITMKGEANSMNDIDKVKAGLGELLKELSISEIKPSDTGKFFFTVVAKGQKR